MKWIFLIYGMVSIIFSFITAPTQLSQTHTICGVIGFSTYYILSEIQKRKQ